MGLGMTTELLIIQDPDLQKADVRLRNLLCLGVFLSLEIVY